VLKQKTPYLIGCEIWIEFIFIQDQSLLLLDRLNDLDLDHEADFCEKLHEDAERLYRSLSARLNEQQDGA
jgi:ABC-type enterochelin transport system ATPase subunit